MQYTLQSEMGKFYPNVLLDIFKSEISFLILGTNVHGLSFLARSCVRCFAGN